MKFKIFVWLFVISVILTIEQVALHVMLPNIDTSTAIEQMNGQSMYDNGFTLRDAAKNTIGLTLCFLWTLVVFAGDLLNLTQRLSQKCLTTLERGKE